jgi:SAM-dependent methyltransferase
VPAVTRYGAYDQFAWFYSKGWGEEYHKQARTTIERHVLPRLPEGARVLDLCCGTGDLGITLRASGCRITGLDGSEEMLRYARQRVPDADFLCEDARTFQLPAVFDAVLSTFDSLNHIVTIEDLEAVFHNVRRALVDGGLFAFDLNMAESFETLWRGSTAVVEEADVSIVRGSYSSEEKLGRAEVTLFAREGELWRRSDVCVLERCYSETEIEDALDRCGFEHIETYDACEVGMRGDIALGRAFFFARKPEPAEP